MLRSLAAMGGWQVSTGQDANVLSTSAVAPRKNLRCLAPWLLWLAGRDRLARML